MNIYELAAAVTLVPGIAAAAVSVWLMRKVKLEVESHLSDRLRLGTPFTFFDNFIILEVHRRVYPSSRLALWSLAILITAIFMSTLGIFLFAISQSVR